MRAHRVRRVPHRGDGRLSNLEATIARTAYFDGAF
jgi:hypothetical protein